MLRFVTSLVLIFGVWLEIGPPSALCQEGDDLADSQPLILKGSPRLLNLKQLEDAGEVQLADGEVALPEPNPELCVDAGPCIADFRVIQMDYSDAGGTVVCLWKNVRGVFDEIIVILDGKARQNFRGEIDGINLGRLPLGRHQVGIVAVSTAANNNVSVTADIVVLSQSPVPPVTITRWLSYGFGGDPPEGYLEIQWEKPPDVDITYQEYEIYVNGTFQGTLPGTRNSITFSRIAPGQYEVELVPFTRNHSAQERAHKLCFAEPVPQLMGAECRLVDCQASRQIFEIAFKAPERAGVPVHDLIAAWASEDVALNANLPQRRWRFLGYSDPTVNPVTFEKQGPTNVLIELAGAQRLENSGDPVFFSNVPRGGGEHTIVHCQAALEACETLDQRRHDFRRGDARGNGAVDISDVLSILFFLFIGTDEPPTCMDSLDVNDDGKISIADAIALLTYLFLDSQRPVAQPGPVRCGPDPTEDLLQDCQHDPCGA